MSQPLTDPVLNKVDHSTITPVSADETTALKSSSDKVDLSKQDKPKKDRSRRPPRKQIPLVLRIVVVIGIILLVSYLIYNIWLIATLPKPPTDEEVEKMIKEMSSDELLKKLPPPEEIADPTE